VAVFGVIKNNGVSVTGVGVKSGVRVTVFKPTNVGVTVYVGVGTVGVGLGISVDVLLTKTGAGEDVAGEAKRN